MHGFSFFLIFSFSSLPKTLATHVCSSCLVSTDDKKEDGSKNFFSLLCPILFSRFDRPLTLIFVFNIVFRSIFLGSDFPFGEMKLDECLSLPEMEGSYLKFLGECPNAGVSPSSTIVLLVCILLPLVVVVRRNIFIPRLSEMSIF